MILNTKKDDVWVTSAAIFCTVTALALSWLYFPITLEDAYITFRYSRNWAGGEDYGVWNPGGERVEGFTTTLWMILLAGAQWAGMSMFMASKLIGMISFIAMPVMCFVAYARNRGSKISGAFIVAAVLMATNLPLAWYATSGMESVFYAALSLAVLMLPYLAAKRSVRTVLAVFLSITIVLTRPEGLVFSGLVYLYWLWSEWKNGEGLFSWPLWGGGAAVATFCTLTLFRIHYFGDWAPNTYYAKAAGGGIDHIVSGAKYVAKFILSSLAFWLALSVMVSMAFFKNVPGRQPWFLIVLMAFFTAYIIKVGGDPVHAFPMYRQYLQIIGVWTLLAGVAVVAFAANARLWVLWGLALTILLNSTMIYSEREGLIKLPYKIISRTGYVSETPPQAFFTWLNELTDEDTVLAVSMAGRWPYYVTGTYIDILGLNNEHIAKYGVRDPSGVIDTKTDMDYVLDQSPDVLDAVLSGVELKSGKCPSALGRYRSKMINDVRKHPNFIKNYYFVTNAPYQESLDRALYVHERFLRLHRNELEAVRVTTTALYSDGCGDPVNPSGSEIGNLY